MKKIKQYIKKSLRHLAQLRYRLPGDYRAETYWRDRLSKYGFDFRGVGHVSLSNEQNEKMYLEAKQKVLSLCEQEQIEIAKTRILDIGCGIGFYTNLFFENGAKHYLGVDITDVLMAELKKTFPEFRFEKLDVSTQHLKGEFDLILMIDVTQHIVKEDKFHFAMQNVRSHLSNTGVFIVTSDLEGNNRTNFHVMSRPISSYVKEFPGYVISEPIEFRDKFIFSIKK